MPNQLGELTDEEVFGAPVAAVAARPAPQPGELSDEDVFGAPATQGPGFLSRLAKSALETAFGYTGTGLAVQDLARGSRVDEGAGEAVANERLGIVTPELSAPEYTDAGKARLEALQRGVATLVQRPEAQGVIENLTEFAGSVAGGMASPEGWVGPGARGATALGRVAKAGAINAGVAAAVDPVLQGKRNDLGLQEGFDWNQYLLGLASAGVGGAALQGAGEAFKRFTAKRPPDAPPPTQEDVTAAAAAGDADAIEILRGAGVTDEQLAGMSPEFRDRAVTRIAERRAKDDYAGAYMPKEPGARNVEQERAAADAIAAGEMDPSRAPIQPGKPQVPPERIVVGPDGTARTGDTSLEAGATLRSGRPDANALVPVEPQPTRMSDEEIRRAQRQSEAGRPAGPQQDTMFVPPERAPQTRDDVAGQRQADEAFRLAEAQRQRAGEGVRDTQPPARPQGGVESQRAVVMDEDFPVQVGERRMVPDSQGRMVEVAKVRRYDPRTGAPDPESVEYEVPVRQLRSRQYPEARPDEPGMEVANPRLSQDFEERAKSPAGEKLGLETQTYRATPPDVEPTGMGAARPAGRDGGPEIRSPRPEQGEGPQQKRWSSAEEAQRDFEERARAREEARARQDAEDEGQRAAREEAAAGAGRGSSNTAKAPDKDGRYEVSERGFVLSDKGGPVVFADQKQAARWILKAQQSSPDQTSEIENHPTKKGGFTVRERNLAERRARQGAQQPPPEPPPADAQPKPEAPQPAADTPPRALPAPERSATEPRAEDASEPPPGGRRWDEEIARKLAASRKPGIDYGLRVLPEDVPPGTKPGDDLWPSSKWEDGEPVGDPLPGTSTIDVGDGSPEAIAKALKQADAYDGSRVVLVSGKKVADGADPGEAVLSGAKVEAMWEKDGPDPGPIVREVGERPAPASVTLSANPLGAVKWVAEALFGPGKEWAENIAAMMKLDGLRGTTHGRADGQTIVGDLLRGLLYTADGHMRNIADSFPGSKTLQDTVNQFFAVAGRGDGAGRTLDEATTMRIDSRIGKVIEPIMQEIRDGKLDHGLVVQMVQNPSMQRGKAGAVAAKIAKLLKEELEYLKAAGVDVGEVKNGYWPRELDMAKVNANRQGFVDAAAKAYRASDPSLSVKDATEMAKAWLDNATFGDVGAPGVARRGEKPSFVQGRVLDKKADAILKDFYLTDVDAVLTRYVSRAAKRAEIARRFGDGWSKWGEIEEKIKAEGAGGAIEHLRGYAATAAGVAFRDTSHATQKTTSLLRTWTTLGMLEKATLSSLMEPFVVAMRSGNLGDAAGTLVSTVKQVFGKHAGDQKVLRELAEDIGIIAGEHANSLMAARFAGGDPIGQRQAKVLANYFRRTGLEQWTNATRVASMRTGQVFIRRLARQAEAGSKDARFFLRELGVGEADIKAFAGWVNSHGDRLPGAGDLAKGGANADAYRTALMRFTDQTVMRPGSTLRPRWASHPVGAVVFQLQAYNYAFGRNVLQRSARLATAAARGEISKGQAAATLGSQLATFFGPIFLGNMALGAARDALFGDPAFTEAETASAKIEKAFSRSGGFGPLDPYVQMLGGTRFNKGVVESFTGPFIGKMGGVLDALIGMFTRNSPNTNTAERRMAMNVYDMAIEPMLNTALTVAPPTALLPMAATTTAR